MSQSVTEVPLDLNLHPKQGEAFHTLATELLYGGAAGGGKSHLMRVAAVVWCASIVGLQVYIFRRIRDDLVKNHMEGPKGFRALLAPWADAGLVQIVEDEIRFWNGSKIYLCHCKDPKDVYKYQGAEIHVLLIDELTHFTEQMYRFLRGRVRMIGIDLPAKFAGMFPRILCGSNPGNVGHLWVKQTFIVPRQPMDTWKTPAKEGGMLRQYIPAQLDDNPSMAEDDPTYEDRLSGLGSDALVRAMRFGDWDIIEGAYFDCWDRARHVVDPFPIPDHWLRIRSMDWGSASPFSVGWWAVASEDNEHVAKGCLVRYREWYGKATTAEGAVTGLKLTAEEVAEGIVDRETYEVDEGQAPKASLSFTYVGPGLRREKMGKAVLDPSAFAVDSGPSIAERLHKNGARFTKADNKRVSTAGTDKRGAMGGWDQVRARLKGDADGNPMLVVFSHCLDTIRTLPALQHDKGRPEDLDTNMEDHAADDIRYGCMSRPFVRKPPPKPRTTIDTSTPTLADLVKRTQRSRRGRERI